MTDHLSGKRIQVVHRVTSNGDVWSLRVFSGTHRIFDISGKWFSWENVRKEQLRLADIMGWKATIKVIKIKKRSSH